MTLPLLLLGDGDDEVDERNLSGIERLMRTKNSDDGDMTAPPLCL